MRSFIALSLSLLSATACAASLKINAIQAGVNDPAYGWSVTNWSAGCARSGCYYDFNITGPQYSPSPSATAIPAFLAYCSGYNEGAPFSACKLLDGYGYDGAQFVNAHLLPVNVTGTGAHIEVSYKFVEDSGAYYNYTGNATATYNQFVAPEENFTITPSSAFAVA